MSPDLGSRFAERAVFVTGADGFVGSHLVESLVEYGADVHAFVRATSSGGLRNIAHLDDEVTVHRGDVRDSHSVRDALAALRPHADSVVFHLAAQAHVGESWERPYETLSVNVEGTLNLLQAVVDLDLDVSKVDVAGTSEEYGDGASEERAGAVAIDEQSTVSPKSIYATSKLASDFLAMNYESAYGVPAVTTRMFNNYGPRQNPRFITPTVITQALERDLVELGNLSPKRDFTYVTDGVRGHMHVALEGTPGEQYVYGYGENISMDDWTDLILEVGSGRFWDDPDVVQTEERHRPGDSDVEALRVACDKLNDETGWEPRVSWREGIRRMIDWFASNKSAWFGRVDWR